MLAGWRTSAYVFVESDVVETRDFLIDAPGSTGGYFSIRTDGRGPGRGLRVSNGTIATTDATDDDLNKSITVDVDDVELRDLDISGAQDGIAIGSHDVLVEGVCIHDLAGTPMSHNDGIEIYSGGRMVIRDATIDNPFGQTSAINITNDFGPIDDVLIEIPRSPAAATRSTCAATEAPRPRRSPTSAFATSRSRVPAPTA